MARGIAGGIAGDVTHISELLGTLPIFRTPVKATSVAFGFEHLAAVCSCRIIGGRGLLSRVRTRYALCCTRYAGRS